MVLIRNYLTKSRYRILLEIVGQSIKPLSSTQIVHQMKGFGKYGYKMIDELCPTSERLDVKLFTWGKVPSTHEKNNMAYLDQKSAEQIQRKFFEKLASVYGLNWLDEDFGPKRYVDLIFEKADHESVFKISYGSYGNIIIKLNRNEEAAKLSIKFDDREILSETLRAISNRGGLGIYRSAYNHFPKYIGVLNSKSQSLIDYYGDYSSDSNKEPDEILAIDSEIKTMRDNRRNWTYYLNIRGLLLYAVAINKEEEGEGKKKNLYISTSQNHKTKSRGRKKGTRSYNILMSKILKNMVENHTNEVPFLMFYNEFKNILPPNFTIKKIKEISYELQYQLDTMDIEELRYFVTKRYYAMITNYFGILESVSIVDYISIGKEGIRKILEYRKKMLEYLIKNVTKEQKQYQKAYRIYAGDYEALFTSA